MVVEMVVMLAGTLESMKVVMLGEMAELLVALLVVTMVEKMADLKVVLKVV